MTPLKRKRTTKTSAHAGTRIAGRARKSVPGLGIMSGTSADGIDVALVRISARGARLENFVELPFPAAVREKILSLGEGRAVTTGEISQLNFLLGETFAEAALAACKKFHIPASKIAFIGSHGQTVFHQGSPSEYCGRKIASTLQIGEPSVIAVRAGITTVGDFRPADMAAGGQGAPLVPFVDYQLYRDEKVGRAALNIGGISNITVIPAKARVEDVFAFDIGPGNMVMDALVQRFSGRRKLFDRDAETARSGKLLPGLLDFLLADKFLARRPPKTAGREQYGSGFVNALLSRPESRHAAPEDLVHTATIFTALAILDAIHRFVKPRANIAELIVSGGGARNPLLMAQIAAGLRGVRVSPSDDYGVPSGAKEAFAFALLAHETLQQRPANVPGATGAKHAVVLGKVCFAGPKRK